MAEQGQTAAVGVNQKNITEILAQDMLYLKLKLWVWCRNEWVRFFGLRHAGAQIR